MMTLLEESVLTAMQNYITGRISCFVPFMPFSDTEAAVVAHKYILELASRVRGPVDLAREELVANIELNVVDDGDMCMHLSKKGYKPSVGARSLKRRVADTVEEKVCAAYTNVDDEIDETRNAMPNIQAVVQLRSRDGGGHEMVVNLR